jgi:hypothetical protein
MAHIVTGLTALSLCLLFSAAAYGQTTMKLVDVRLIYYKPIRGDEPGNYITVFALTKASRDRYWPGGKDSDALRTTVQPAHAIRDELQTYLVDGSFATGNLVAAIFESRQWADWVIVTR